MELYKEILAQILRKGEVKISFPDFEGNISEAVESASYKALSEIKEIISDKSLDDKECFWKIEKIVRALEESGISCGGRHDF